MTQARVRWGRVFMFLLLLTSGIGYATFPRWQGSLVGTPLEPLPGELAKAWNEGRSLTSALWNRFFGAELETTRVLPEDTLALLTTQKLGDAVQVLAPLISEQPSSDMLAAIKGALSPSNPDHQALKTQLEALESIGIDQKRPFCMALLPVGSAAKPASAASAGDQTGGSVTLAIIGLLPVQSKDALSALQHLLERQGRTVTPLVIGGEEALGLEEDVVVRFWNRHLLFTLGQEADPGGGTNSPTGTTQAQRIQSVEQVLARLNNPGKTLAENEQFTSLLRAHGDDWHILVWGAIGSSLARLLEHEDAAVASTLRAIDGSVLAGVHLSDKRLRVRTAARTRLSNKGALLTEKPDPDFLEHLRGRPLAVGTAGVNLSEALEQIKAEPNAQEELAKLERLLKDEAHLSLTQDLIPAFRGTGGLVVLEGQNEPAQGSVMGQLMQAAGRQLEALAGMRWPINGLIWLDIKNAAPIKQLLPHLPLQDMQENQAVTQQQDSQGTWIDAGLGGIGVTQTQVLMTVGPGLLAQVRTQLGEGSVAKAEQSWTLLDQDIRTQLERKDPAYFYVDLARTMQVAAAFPAAKVALSSTQAMAIKDMVEATIRGFSSRTWLEDEIWMSEYMLLGPENGLAAEAGRFRQAAARLNAQ